MSAMVLQAGELVDIAIKGARVEAYNGGYFTVAPTGGAHITIETGSTGVRVTRVAPAEWPPQVGDLWLDASGSEWFAPMRAKPELESTTAGSSAADWVLGRYGPMTLAYRKGWTPAPAADVDQADEVEPKLDERSAVIAGIRELADFLEAHPGLPVNRYTVDARHYVRHDRNLHTDEARHDELERLAAVMGVEPMPREAPYEGARHRLAVKKFSGGWGFEVCLTDAYQQPTDLAPGGNEVAGPVLVGPATARTFDLGPVPDADGDLIAPVEPEHAHTYGVACPATGCRWPLDAPAVESDADALDQIGVAATDPAELEALMPELMSLGAPEDLAPAEVEIWCGCLTTRLTAGEKFCAACLAAQQKLADEGWTAAAERMAAPVVDGDDTTGGEP
jgi:hypothetical protein